MGWLASGDQSGKMLLPASDQQVTWVLWTLAGPRAHLCQQHCSLGHSNTSWVSLY